MLKLFIYLISLIGTLIAQNLVYNGDFEIYTKCPSDVSQIEKADGWYNPNQGTSDYFNKCASTGMVSVPNNISGRAVPENGQAYVGIGVFFGEKEPAYEFIQSKLVHKIEANKLYCVSYYVYKGKKSSDEPCTFLCILSPTKIKSTKWNNFGEDLKTENHFFQSTINNKLKNKFQKIAFLFSSNLGEEYITIGFNKIDFNLRINKNKETYYYIDDVSLLEIKDSSECACNEVKPIKKDSVKVEIVKSYFDSADVKAFVLNNLVFESNKSKLMPASNAELDKLVNYLKTNPAKTIELFGYTDNTGKELDNVKLSEARVKLVADYLMNKGIETKRITFKGYGSKNPIKPNDTELNKAKNRRVEFKIK